MGFGIGAGQVVGGIAGAKLGWRAPFALFAVPLTTFVFVAWALLPEPRRGAADGLRRSSRGSGLDWRPGNACCELARISTLWLVLSQCVIGSIPWGAINVFFIDYLHADAGYTVPEATIVNSAFGTGMMLGQFFGMWAGQTTYNRSSSLMPLYVGTVTAIGAVPMVSLWRWAWWWHYFVACAVTFVAGFFSAQADPNVRCMLQNVTPPLRRGIAFALFTSLNAVGTGWGPLCVGWLSASLGRRSALQVATLCWLPCAAIHWCIGLTISEDEERVRCRLIRNPSMSALSFARQASFGGLMTPEKAASPSFSAAPVRGVDLHTLGKL
eukprot:gene51930-44307_t